MNLEEIRGLAFKHMGKRKAHPYREQGFIYYHGQRVGAIALHLRKRIFPQQSNLDDVISAASWFHDLGKGIEPHWEYGALLAREILAPYCTPVELEQIAEIIGSHTLRKQGDSYPDYVKLVQDADILDHFGTVEIWLNFFHSAYSEGTMLDSVRFYKEEYSGHAQIVRQLLNYSESVKIFDEKDQFVREFAARMEVEARGHLMISGEQNNKDVGYE